MSKDVTVEIQTIKTYYVEVDDDFDFEDEDALNALAERTENDTTPDTEDWEQVTISDETDGGYYYI